MFVIRASGAGHIMGGNIGLTEKQTEQLEVLEAKEKRTEKQGETMQELIEKRDNPVLPQGAKTYCKDWLKGQIFNRRPDFSNKYTDKGHIMEDNSIDFVSDFLEYGMVMKNEEKKNED